MAPDGNPRPNPRPPEDPSVYNVPTPEPARKPKGKTGWIKGLAAAIVFVALAFAFSRLIPGSGSPTDPPGNWKNNVFKTNSEHIRELSPEELSQAPLLPGIGWERQAIRSVTFLSKQSTTGAVADISVDGDGSVVAWVQSDGELCDLYIAGNGGINAADACPYMFAGCTNLIRVDFGDGFHTDYATDMSHMFYGCTSLTKLDLSSFNTEQVTDMSNMFSYCSSLTELDLSSFNTEQVTVMAEMFWGCPGVTVDDVAHFDTSSVTSFEYFMDGTGWEYLFS